MSDETRNPWRDARAQLPPLNVIVEINDGYSTDDDGKPIIGLARVSHGLFPDGTEIWRWENCRDWLSPSPMILFWREFHGDE